MHKSKIHSSTTEIEFRNSVFAEDVRWAENNKPIVIGFLSEKHIGNKLPENFLRLFLFGELRLKAQQSKAIEFKIQSEKVEKPISEATAQFDPTGSNWTYYRVNFPAVSFSKQAKYTAYYKHPNKNEWLPLRSIEYIAPPSTPIPIDSPFSDPEYQKEQTALFAKYLKKIQEKK